MKRFFLLPLFVCLCYSGFAQHHNANYIDGKLYVRLKTTDTTFGLSNLSLAPLAVLFHMDTCYRPFWGLGSDSLDRTYCIRYSDTANTSACMDSLRALQVVDLVEEVPLFRTNYIPNDLNSNQYALTKINALSAWNISKGSTSVIVAIVDNGILNTHQDLAANMVAGYDVANNDNNPAPPVGFAGSGWNHGTHCSGIASAVTDNGTGIASIGFNTKIMPVKCTSDTNKTGDEIEYADEGITYAVQHGAKVISMSFGGYQSAQTEQLIISTANAQGIVLVAAAGNDDSTGLYYPAAYNGVIDVAASDQNDAKASFSNYGSRIDIMAPGYGIYSTFASSTSAYGTFSGTSMSTPLVAGLAALVLAVNPSFTPAQVLTAIKSSADNVNAENPNYVGQLGAGRINAYHALGGTGPGVSGIEPLKTISDITYYPNPFNDKLFINLDNMNDITSLQLLDVQGRVVFEKQLNQKLNNQIETSAVSKGIYLLKVITSTGIKTGKVVKM